METLFYSYSKIIHTETPALFMAKTPDGHFVAIGEYFLDKTLCTQLYNKKGYKIPCWTRAEQKRYPKRSGLYARDILKHYKEFA
jgi:hypothetical protein